ncbi:MAG TPA: iron-containing redox enzyme family protein [Methylomirabilota bacterium]|nr:iron-containing redox enzyme family protein [Methylomirabilota bacterium]
MPTNSPSVIDEICDYALSVAADMPWLSEPLTKGRGRAYLLQHIPRNRVLSSVIRPAWMSRCPDLAVVRKTIGQMREELVCDDQIAQPHTAILWQMGRNVGLTDEQMNTTRPVPLVEVAFNVWENIARTRHWIAGWLATSVDEFIITAMPKHNFQAEAWRKTFGLNEEQVFFFTYHTKADDEHAGRRVWEPIVRHLTNDKDKQEVIDGMKLALTALTLFYQGICELGDQMDRDKS